MILADAQPTSIDVTYLSQIALVIFMAIFIGIVLWVCVLRRKGYKQESQIPLDDDKVVTPRNGADDRRADNK